VRARPLARPVSVEPPSHREFVLVAALWALCRLHPVCPAEQRDPEPGQSRTPIRPVCSPPNPSTRSSRSAC